MATFSIELFDALSAIGFLRVRSPADLVAGRKLAIESFPTSAWRTLGLKALPGKSRASASQVNTWTTTLRKLIRFTLTRTPTQQALRANSTGILGTQFSDADISAPIRAADEKIERASQVIKEASQRRAQYHSQAKDLYKKDETFVKSLKAVD